MDNDETHSKNSWQSIDLHWRSIKYDAMENNDTLCTSIHKECKSLLYNVGDPVRLHKLPTIKELDVADNDHKHPFQNRNILIAMDTSVCKYKCASGSRQRVRISSRENQRTHRKY